MKIVKFLEFKDEDLQPIKSFSLKDELNPRVWDEFEIKDKVRQELIVIAHDFYEGTKLKTDIDDIVMCGSLSNYNWSQRYSDFDLHVIINYYDVDENYELVEKLCDYAKKIWNLQHDIKIEGYGVEIALQDKNSLLESIDRGKMGGVFSLLNNKWIKKPKKINFIPDEDLILEKAQTIMMIIDDIEREAIESKYDIIDEKISKVWKKIKDYRKSGLESEGGEFSIGNLVFKFLRRNGYLEKIMSLKREYYDKQFS